MSLYPRLFYSGTISWCRECGTSMPLFSDCVPRAAVSAIALALMTTAAHATAPCLPTIDAFAKALQSGYGEVPQTIGMKGDGLPLIIFANPATGTWTIIIQAQDGRFCSPASGKDYHAAPKGAPT